jgi:hypothetical protein
MVRSESSFRRWTGAIFLTIAILMVVLGFTFLEPHLHGRDFIFYWMICFGFTVAASLIALIDMSAVRRRAIREQQRLIETTIDGKNPKDELEAE